jgi:hypothetical protein
MCVCTGVPSNSCFTPLDLHESRDIMAVVSRPKWQDRRAPLSLIAYYMLRLQVRCLYALARCVAELPDYIGPQVCGSCCCKGAASPTHARTAQLAPRRGSRPRVSIPVKQPASTRARYKRTHLVDVLPCASCRSSSATEHTFMPPVRSSSIDSIVSLPGDYSSAYE